MTQSIKYTRRPNIFVARPAEAPYVTNAENVKLIDDLRLMGLPPTIQNLVRKDGRSDKTYYCIIRVTIS